MKRKSIWLTGPYLFWIIAFIVLPLVMIVYYGITDDSGSFTFSNIAAIADPLHLNALMMSILLALVSTAICLVLSYPLAMILNKGKEKNRSLLLFVFILPMWMNFMLRTLAWKLILSNNGILNNILELIGLPGVQIINTPMAVVFGMVSDFLPFMLLPIYNAIGKIGKDVIHAAQDLGADGMTIFCKIIVPLSLPGAVSGTVMVFIPAMTSFVISDLLGGGKVDLIGNIIEHEFNQYYNWHLGSGLSIVLMVLVVLGMVLSFASEKKEAQQK